MPSEAEVKYGYCPRCGAKSVDRERRLNGNDRCENGHQYPSAHATPTPYQTWLNNPPQAEVVASRDPKVPTASEASEIALKFINHFFNNPGRDKPRASIPADPLRDDDLRLMAFIRSVKPPPAQGKEKTCSDESQGGGTASPQNSKLSSSASPDASSATPPTASLPNPPAWATPQILAACGPGERLRHRWNFVRAYPSRKCWDHGKLVPHETCWPEQDCNTWGHDLYTIPTPPAAKCRCGGPFGAAFYTCENERFCSTCFHKYFERAKPEPKDGAEDAARKVVYDWNQTDHNAYSEGVLTDNELASLESRITAAIRADREKQAARPATELRGKIQQLCEKAKEINGQIQAEGRHGHVVCGMSEMLNALAREVLAQLEGK